MNKKKESTRWIRNKTCDDKDHDCSSNLLSKVIFYLLLCSFIVVSAYVFLFSEFLKVENISVEGAVELQGKELGDVIAGKYDGNYLNFLPKNNYLLVSSKKIEELLLDSFKKIKSVEVERKFPNQIGIKIQERKSLLIWCSGDRCFMVDDDGNAYMEADFSSRQIQENHLIRIVEDDGKAVWIGEQVMDGSVARFYLELRDAFKEKAGLALGEEFHISSRLAEDVTAKAEIGFDILVNFSIPAERSALLMKTFLDKQYKGGDLANLAYVDLRVENKIFYKTK